MEKNLIKKLSIRKLFIKRRFQMILASIIIIVVWYFLIRNNTIVVQKYTHINRQIYNDINSGFRFRYPKFFSGNVRSPTNWPTPVTVVSKTQNPIEIGCPNLKDINYSLKKNQWETNNGLKYFLYKWTDVWAGSLYSTYCYIIESIDNYYVLNFEIRSHSGCWDDNCGAYCSTKFEQECKDLDIVKDIENNLNKIVYTFKILK